MGRTALTAACFCVFLTLDTATFLVAVLRVTGFGAAFFVLTADLDLAAVFLATPAFAVLRASGLAVAALRALGLAGDFALTARFALFAVDFAFERDADRLKPFVRLLLMGGNLKRLLSRSEQPWSWPAAYHRRTSKSMKTTICGCFKASEHRRNFDKCINKEKT